jgi:hypothetical protein
MAKADDELCPRCFVGRLQKGQAAFIAVYEGQLVTVPGAVAFTCDICNYREFDDPVVEWVAEIVGLEPTIDPLQPPRRPSAHY